MSNRKYTAKEQIFFWEYVPGHSHKEIQAAFNERFQPEIDLPQVKAYVKNHKLNTGRTGRFEKGHIPPNKGRKGYCAPGCEKGHFKMGNIPANRVPIGTEKQRDDGYIWVKIQDGHLNANWRQKHYLVWESAHGPIPEGKVLMFMDGDRTNTSLENLKLVTKNQVCRLNYNGLICSDPELTETGIVITDLITAMAGRKRDLKRRRR